MMPTHRTELLADELKMRLDDLAEDSGRVSATVREIAAVAGYSERHVWRTLDTLKISGALPGIESFSLEDDHIEVLVQLRGNIEGTRKYLELHGFAVPSPSTFRRAALSELGTRALAGFKEGAKGMRSKQVFLAADDRPRNHTWQTDHAHLPLRVTVDGEPAGEVWFTSILDVGSRMLLAYVLTVGRANSGSIRDVILGALFGSRAPDGSRLGGCPELVLWDRGADFLADIVKSTTDAFQVLGVALPAYSPHRKGKIERFHRTLKAECIDLLDGSTRGPTNLRGDSYNLGESVTLEALEDAVAEYVDQYNYARPHTSLGGRTPYEAWMSDSTPLRVAPRHKVLDAMVRAKKPRKMSHEGIAAFSRKYKPLFPKPPVGLHVEIRYLPNDLDSIEVFLQGKHLGTAVDGDAMTSRDTEEFLAIRRDDNAFAHKTRRAARSRRQKRSPVTTMPGSSLAIPSDGSLASQGASALESLRAGEGIQDADPVQMDKC